MFARSSVVLVSLILAACGPAIDERDHGEALSPRDAQLRLIQRELMAKYDVLADADPSLSTAERRALVRTRLVGFIPTHPNLLEEGQPDRVFKDTGIVYGRLDEAGHDDNTAVDPLQPALLLFDDHYRLIGCGFARAILVDDPTPPRGLELDPSEWFIHNAGAHKADGSFAPRSSLWDAAWHGDLEFHPEMWDVHVFFVDGGTPQVGMTVGTLDAFNAPLPDGFTFEIGVPNAGSGVPGDDVEFYRAQ